MRAVHLMVTAGLLAVLAPAPHAQAQDCAWYARKALEQQKRNSDQRCNLKGPEWNLDANAHLAWCRGVAPQDSLRQAQLRDQLLAKCGTK